MKRYHLFEIHEQKWMPGCIREAFTEVLNTIFRISGFYKRAGEIMQTWVSRLSGKNILELASGGAGPTAVIADTLEKRNIRKPRIFMSDLYPQTGRYRDLCSRFPDTMGYEDQPVDALEFKGRGYSGWMMCNSFHHFRPEYAARILNNALEYSEGILILSPMQRNIFRLFSALLNCLFILPAVLCIRPFSLKKAGAIVLSAPLLAVMLVIDGAVSVLRAYRPEELVKMAKKDNEDIVWEWGNIRYAYIFRGIYVMGYRVRADVRGTVSIRDHYFLENSGQCNTISDTRKANV